MKNVKLFIALLVLGSLCNSCKSQTPKEKLLDTKRILENVYLNDQKYRGVDYMLNWQKQDSIDKENLVIVSKIIDSLGWLGKDVVGDTANDALFAVIQHSNITTMEKYLPVMRKAAAENKASKQNLALLIDRVEVINKRKQIYGSQLYEKDGKYTLYDVVEPAKLNERRKEMGLGTIEEYLKQFWNQ
jgi:hypothetical protein